LGAWQITGASRDLAITAMADWFMVIDPALHRRRADQAADGGVRHAIEMMMFQRGRIRLAAQNARRMDDPRWCAVGTTVVPGVICAKSP
jgi:hypothetical protein